jgi:Alpha/beta hydrolase
MSRLTLSDLQAGDPRAFRAAATEWDALAADLDSAYEQLRLGQDGVEHAGQGAAIGAAARQVRIQGRRLSDLVLPARRIAQALLAHADGLATLQHQLDAVLRSATDHIGAELAELQARAQRLDEATTATIRATVALPGSARGAAVRLDEAALRRQVGRAPTDVHAWWRSLSPEQQERALREHPQLVGGLDGIPATDRDRANRRYLDQLLAVDAPPPALVALHDRLAAIDDAYLLLIDGAGDGRAVVAVGDPDHARHTAVFVPGVGSDLRDIDGELALAAQLRRTADLATIAAGDVSIVSWLGYDPPDSLLDGWREGPSRQGGAALSPFVDGLRVTHAPTPEAYHVTAVGYSYGSTVVAEAALGGQLRADDIVVVGSPGLHSDHASELHLDPRHVWVGRADNDEIGFAPGFIHGPEPADPDYGANQFTTTTSGHGGYWRPDSDSLLNQAYIITGQYGRVTLGHGQRPG